MEKMFEFPSWLAWGLIIGILMRIFQFGSIADAYNYVLLIPMGFFMFQNIKLRKIKDGKGTLEAGTGKPE
jgi:hypothetical protein